MCYNGYAGMCFDGCAVCVLMVVLLCFGCLCYMCCDGCAVCVLMVVLYVL
jgi:hypothetical protein